LTFLTDQRTAVAAGILERTDFTILSSDDDDLIGTDTHRDTAAAFLELAGRNRRAIPCRKYAADRVRRCRERYRKADQGNSLKSVAQADPRSMMR
ncbi:MAG: hypothetical protein P8011_19305, partial [Acidihalobacter sp.]